MTIEVNKAIAKGAVWVTLIRLSYRLIGVVSTIILARLLEPHDFGLIAIAMSFYLMIELLSNSGMQIILVQNQNATADDYNTAWTINFIIGLLSACVLFFFADNISRFYGYVEIKHILYTVSVLFVINGLKNIGVVDFQKNLTFEKEFKLLIVPKIISFFVTIILALWLRTFWALVIGNVIYKVVEVIGSYVLHPFRPAFCLKKKEEMFRFSKWLMINNVFIYINSHLPELILGKVAGPKLVASYTMSYEITSTVTTELIAGFNRAIFPGYSKVANNKNKLKVLYSKTLAILGYISIPMGVGLATVSPVLVPVLLGPKWAYVIDPLIYLSLGGAVLSIKSNTTYIYYVLEKPYFVTVELAVRAIFFIVLTGMLYDVYGVVGVALAFLISAVILFLLSVFIVSKLLRISIVDQLMLYIRPGISSLAMSLLVFWYIGLNDNSSLLKLIISILIGVVTYVSCLLFLWVLTGKKSGIEAKVLKYAKAYVSF